MEQREEQLADQKIIEEFKKAWDLPEVEVVPPEWDNIIRTDKEQILVDKFNEKFEERKKELEKVLEFLVDEKELKMTEGYLGGN
jgi:hypothetical protein